MKKTLKLKDEKHLARALGIPIGELDFLVKQFPMSCRKHFVDQGDKVRVIINTTDKYKRLHKKILRLLPNRLLSPSVHGWNPGFSIKTSALEHTGNPAKICMDLKNCFPNIHSTRVRKLFEEDLHCSPAVANILTRLTTHDYCLAQGFATSGMILNLIMSKTDESICRLITPYKMKYTRYGDDITISGAAYIRAVHNKVKELLVKNGFTLNMKKEQISYGESSPLVTGINCSGNKPKVPRLYKRNLRAQQHRLLKLKDDELNKESRSIAGKKQFIKYIESK